MAKIYRNLFKLERKLYNKNKELHKQAIEVAKNTWDIVKANHSEYLIDIEPLLFQLYNASEAEFKKAGIKPTLFNKLYDHYATQKASIYEVRSLRLSDEIWNVTNDVMIKRIKNFTS